MKPISPVKTPKQLAAYLGIIPWYAAVKGVEPPLTPSKVYFMSEEVIWGSEEVVF